MLYISLTLLAAAILVLLLRLRIRLSWSDERRLLFIGLGRTGPEIDFARRRGVIRLCGIRIKSFGLSRDKRTATPPKTDGMSDSASTAADRRTSLRDLLPVLPAGVSAMAEYAVSLLRAVSVEQMEGKAEGGFDSPDLTGRVYGYYQAVLGAVPNLTGRFIYVPDWSGAPWRLSGRFSAAVPLYRVVFSTLVLVYKLPKRDLIRIARGKKKGVRRGK